MTKREETFDELSEKASNPEETLKILEQIDINNERIKEKSKNESKKQISKKSDSFLTDDEVVEDIGNLVDVEKINERFVKKNIHSWKGKWKLIDQSKSDLIHKTSTKSHEKSNKLLKKDTFFQEESDNLKKTPEFEEVEEFLKIGHDSSEKEQNSLDITEIDEDTLLTEKKDEFFSLFDDIEDELQNTNKVDKELEDKSIDMVVEEIGSEEIQKPVKTEKTTEHNLFFIKLIKRIKSFSGGKFKNLNFSLFEGFEDTKSTEKDFTRKKMLDLVTIDFTLFAKRPHDRLASRLSMEKLRDKKLFITLFIITSIIWIVFLISTGFIKIPTTKFVLETYQEWEVRMSKDPIMDEILTMNRTNNLTLSGQQTGGNNIFAGSSVSTISSEDNLNVQNATDKIGNVQRALRVLSAETSSPFGSGDASIREFIENPSEISIFASSGSPISRIGIGEVMTTIGIDTSQIGFISAQGGELSHQVRVEISNISPLIGEPAAIAHRSGESINRVFNRYRSSVQYTFNKYKDLYPDMSGKIVFNIVVDAHGRVISATIASSTINIADFQSSLKELILKWQFPALEDTLLNPVTITLPFNFIEF